MLRRLSTSRLVAFCTALTALVALGAAIAAGAFAGGAAAPASKPLAQAVHDALAARPVDGVTARISFTNHLVDSTDIQGGRGQPLLNGASGRLWASKDGHLRIELQSSRGDTQILSDGRTASLYDSQSNTVYRATLPRHRAGAGHKRAGEHLPTVKEIQDGITKLMKHANVSGAQPGSLAGQPAYTVSVSPKQHGGLLGSAALAWDAVRGVPLRIAVYAKHDSTPVLELKVTDISYGPVSASDFAVSPPKGAKVSNVATPTGRGTQRGAHRTGRGHAAEVHGLAAVQAKVPFHVSAPPRLAGRSLSDVLLVQGKRGSHPGALVLYGEGLDGIAVLERQPEARKSGGPSSPGGSRQSRLPTVTVNGSQATELPTALGTFLHFERGGVGYTVAGSVSRGVAETAARGL